MNYRIIKYYKKEVSVDALVTSHMKGVDAFNIFILWIFFLASLSSIITGFLLVNNVTMPFYISVSIFIISLPCLWVSMKTYISRAKEIVRKTLGITSYGEKWSWRTAEFDKHQIDLMVDFLTAEDMMKKWKIEKVIDSLKKEKNKNKIPPLIAPAVFITLTVPNLTQFLTYLYEVKEDQEILIFISTLFATVFLVVFLNIINKSVQKFKDYFLGDFYHKDNLMVLLEEVLYTLNE
jgi:hypothetical protein